MRAWLAGLALLGLAACEEAGETLRIGGKDFAESTILSEMMAALAEDAGIPVTRRTALGDTLVNLEALKAGDIDLYAEYNGTGLVMLGQPPVSDGDEATERVRALYEPLGLVWGERFGFENNYGLAMREGRAEALGVETISELVGVAGDLTVGLDENFAERPLDGFEALTARYGMSFGDVAVVPPEERIALYDRLLAGEVDVAEVFTTDGQLADLDLRLLEDDLDFFPVYQAAPLVRSDALVRFPELRATLARLDGVLDGPTMRRLNARVERDALSPREVARAALADLGLIDEGEGLQIDEPVVVAHSPLVATDAAEGIALRAVRGAYANRRVVTEAVDDPLAAVGAGRAPLALVAAVELADLDAAGAPTPRPFEGLGVVGQTLVHLVSLDGAAGLEDVARLAVGPPGSASFRAGAVLAAGTEGGMELVAATGDEPLAAIAASDADAALVVAPLGSPAVAALLEAGGRLVPVDGWERGNNLVRFPQLRRARIPAGAYEGQAEALETLSSQLILAGPVVEDVDALGPQGPAASAPTDVAQLADETVLALSEGLEATTGLDPAVRAAAALRPTLPEPAATVNPSTSISALTAGVLALFAWLVYLYARPEHR